jgi:hypothetical protein
MARRKRHSPEEIVAKLRQVSASPGLVEHHEPGVPLEPLERLEPGPRRESAPRARTREHEARQAEVPPGDHSREDRGEDHGGPGRS